jgi:signal transduction histidine kinase
VAGLLDAPGCGDGQSGSPLPEVVALEAEQREPQRDELVQLREQVDELRASRARLVLAADVDCRAMESDLHEGVQQHLVALAVKLQLAAPLVDEDPAAAKALLDEMERDVQEALDEAARLAQRIYPQLLEAGELAGALRSAAVSTGVPASVDVEANSTYSPEVLRTVYLCWLEALDHARGAERATATLREEHGALRFEFVEAHAGSEAASEWSPRLEGLRDRVEALGGRLTIEAARGRGIYLSGSLPSSG